MEKFIKNATKDSVIPKHHTSNLYARNVMNGMNDKDDSQPSKQDEVTQYMREQPHRDEEISGMSLKQIRQRYRKRHQKSRIHSRALGYSSQNIGNLRQANKAYVDRTNLIDPNASSIPPRPINLILQQQIRNDENDIDRVLDILRKIRQQEA